MSNVKLIGTTRFSLYSPGAAEWRTSRQGQFHSEEDYREFLFSESRIGLRTEIFTKYSVPQLSLAAERAQVDLRHIVSFSELLPGRYRDMLAETSDRYPFLILDERGIESDTNVTPVDYYADTFRNKEGVFAWYRLDDDDIVASNFFLSLKPYVDEPFVGMTVSLGRGITGLWNEGRYRNLRSSHWVFNSIGQAYICSYEGGKIRWNPPGSHSDTDLRSPTIVDSRQPNWLWTRHLTQDTAVNYSEEEARQRILAELNLSPILPSSFDFNDLFPYVTEVLRHPLLDQHQLNGVGLDEDVKIAFSQPSNSFTIELDATFDGSAAINNALISLDLVDSKGENISLDQKIQGLGTSSNPRIGFWKYLRTPPGRSRRPLTIILPKEIYCVGLSIVKWARLETKVQLHTLNIAYE